MLGIGGDANQRFYHDQKGGSEIDYMPKKSVASDFKKPEHT